MFIDSVKIHVRSGNGGRGCSSLYKDKYTRLGIPDGGDGGNGGDIVVQADRNILTLYDFQFKRHFYAKHGEHGSGKNRKGKDAEAVVIHVPIGTIVIDAQNKCILRDLTTDQEKVIVAKGGRGGLGNKPYMEATSGEETVEKEILLDLKIIADAGVIGFPSVGKSTLISMISNAHPEIAAYHFTTKSPVLGVVRAKSRNFIMADIPGLIEGSSEGKGLGDKFLRHVERTRVLVHIIDMSGAEGRDPVSDYRAVNKEIKNYSKEVFRKPQVIVANKMDLDGAKDNLIRFRKTVRKKIYPISALKKEGLEVLVEAIAKEL